MPSIRGVLAIAAVKPQRLGDEQPLDLDQRLTNQARKLPGALLSRDGRGRPANSSKIVNVQHAVEIDTIMLSIVLRQLADVSGQSKAISLSRAEVDISYRLVMPLGELADEMLDQEGNILVPLDQPRKRMVTP